MCNLTQLTSAHNDYNVPVNLHAYVCHGLYLWFNPCALSLLLSLQDTDVIVWDVINECGLFRLKGHKDSITQALFLENHNLLVTR